MPEFMGVTPGGYRVTAEAATIEEAADQLTDRGYEVLDFASDTEIVIADDDVNELEED